MKQINEGRSPVVVDVRSKKEFDEGHVPGAIHLPFWKAGREWRTIASARELPVVVYCGHGPTRISRRRRTEAARVQEHFLPRGTYETMERDEASTRACVPAPRCCRTRRTAARSANGRCGRRGGQVLARVARPVGTGACDRHVSRHMVGNRERRLEETCAGPWELLSDRLGRQNLSDDGARGRPARVAGGIPQI